MPTLQQWLMRVVEAFCRPIHSHFVGTMEMRSFSLWWKRGRHMGVTWATYFSLQSKGKGASKGSHQLALALQEVFAD